MSEDLFKRKFSLLGLLYFLTQIMEAIMAMAWFFAFPLALVMSIITFDFSSFKMTITLCLQLTAVTLILLFILSRINKTSIGKEIKSSMGKRY
jgi:hypothetical protein